MSENIDERNSIISYKQIWSGVGSGVALILGTVLVGEKVKLNYTVVAIICAVFAIITMIPACFKLEERFGGDRMRISRSKRCSAISFRTSICSSIT